MKLIIILTFIILSTLAQERVMYFHGGDQDYPKEMDLSDMRNKPLYVVLDCTKINCEKFVKTDYPALYYWKGPGSAF